MLPALSLLAVIAGAPVAPSGAPPAPNIVIVFADDQGYGDLGVHGARGFATPNLDRMAREGVRFTDFYVAQPVCSASRAALLTGCYPNRIGIAGALGPGAKHGLAGAETTIAEVCRDRGHATAVYGKWHLGHLAPFLPVRHGFDDFYGTPYSNDMWPLHPDLVVLPEDAVERKRRYPDLPVLENEGVADPKVTYEDQRRFTSDFAGRAVEFIDAHHDGRFFLYLAHPMPHVPLAASDRFAGTTEAGLYGDVISEIDWSVGRILEALRRHGIEEHTLVIFTSDNGPWLSYGNHAGTTGPLREGKGTTFEGGVRVPCIMWWPGRIAPGGVCREPAMTIDLLPTIAGLLDAPLPARRIDGRDIRGLVFGEPGATSPHEALFFYYRRNDLEAMRSGRWKLHFPHGYRSMEGREPGRDGMPGKYDYGRRTGVELYDLRADIGETTDVAAENPGALARLRALAAAARHDLGDNLTGTHGGGRREPGRVTAEE